jgi:hypothetical protein
VGPVGGDLYFIAYGATGTGSVECMPSPAPAPTRSSLRTGTALGGNVTTADARFLVAKGSEDLYAVLHGPHTGSGRT